MTFDALALFTPVSKATSPTGSAGLVAFIRAPPLSTLNVARQISSTWSVFRIRRFGLPFRRRDLPRHTVDAPRNVVGHRVDRFIIEIQKFGKFIDKRRDCYWCLDPLDLVRYSMILHTEVLFEMPRLSPAPNLSPAVLFAFGDPACCQAPR